MNKTFQSSDVDIDKCILLKSLVLNTLNVYSIGAALLTHSCLSSWMSDSDIVDLLNVWCPIRSTTTIDGDGDLRQVAIVRLCTAVLLDMQLYRQHCRALLTLMITIAIDEREWLRWIDVIEVF